MKPCAPRELDTILLIQATYAKRKESIIIRQCSQSIRGGAVTSPPASADQAGDAAGDFATTEGEKITI